MLHGADTASSPYRSLKGGRGGADSRARRGLAVTLGVTVSFLLVSGCAAPAGRGALSALPFFSWQEDFDANADGVADGRHLTVPLLGVSWSSRPEVTTSEGESRPARERLRVLFPFGDWKQRGGDSDLRLLAFIPILNAASQMAGAEATTSVFPALVYHSRRTDDQGRQDHDFGVLPLFVAGSDSEEGGYLAVAPFGGVTRGLLGKDEAVWLGFPYPLGLWARDRGFESWHVMAPFVNWVEGDGRAGGRFWPFFGHYTRRTKAGELRYDRLHVMWPFFTMQQNNLDGARPVTTIFAFPFFGSVRSEKTAKTTVLFPFFKWSTQSDPGWWELRAPFPFVIVSRGEVESRTDVWPLFGVKTREYPDSERRTSRMFVMWPCFRIEREEDEDGRNERLFALPFFWTTARYDAAPEEPDGVAQQASRRNVKIWPFLHYRRGADGSLDIHALSPFYWEDQDGAERIYYPLVRLFQYQRSAAGDRSLGLLLGLYSDQWSPARPEEGVPERERRSFLFGLVHYRRDGGERALRLFWLPEIRWGEVTETGADGPEVPVEEVPAKAGEDLLEPRPAPAVPSPELEDLTPGAPPPAGAVSQAPAGATAWSRVGSNS